MAAAGDIPPAVRRIRTAADAGYAGRPYAFPGAGGPALLPLYIASQLYKHDNVQLAVLWRNEFEMGRELLQLEQRQRGQESGQAAFVAERWF